MPGGRPDAESSERGRRRAPGEGPARADLHPTGSGNPGSRGGDQAGRLAEGGDVEAHVEGRGAVGEPAHRQEVDARGRDLGGGLGSDAAGGLGDRPAGAAVGQGNPASGVNPWLAVSGNQIVIAGREVNGGGGSGEVDKVPAEEPNPEIIIEPVLRNQYLTKLKRLLPTFFDEFNAGEIESAVEDVVDPEGEAVMEDDEDETIDVGTSSRDDLATRMEEFMKAQSRAAEQEIQ